MTWKCRFMSFSLHLLLSNMTLSKLWKISNLIENQCFSVFHFLIKLNLDESHSNFYSINIFIINSHMYSTHNHTSCQFIFCLVNDLLKIITATKKASLIRLVSQSANQLINHNFQSQSNFWWLSLTQQLHQNLSQSILVLNEKSTFVMIRIDMNMSSKINCNHSILFDCIMLQKISILTTRIFIMLIWIKFKIIRISVLIKRNQNNLNWISKIILLIMLIFLIQKQKFADSVSKILHLTICFISIF